MRVVLVIHDALSMLPLPVQAQGEGNPTDLLKQRMELYEQIPITT